LKNLDSARPVSIRKILKEDLASPDKVIQLGVQPNRIDILTSISGVGFDDAWATRREDNLEGIPTHFIGLEALIRNKRTTGRAKDLGDAEELSRRLAPGQNNEA
jgi:hypothetical protein